MDYFFSAQIRQYRLQIIRAFSNFSVSVGENADGTPKLKRVPCRYGDTSRIAETIITGNSENKIPSAPFISVYVTGMALSPERRAAPSFVSTVNINERAYDGEKYLDVPGNRYTVQRYTPVPFMMTVNVDFWCSNLNQKEELFEQTQVLYNGMVDIQTSNNPLDWTLFSTIEPTNITWSSRSIPIGTDNPIDVMTVEYRVPIWINPPAKVTYQKVIQQIVTRIHSATSDPEDNWEWRPQDLLTTKITTPDDANIICTLVDDYTYEIQLCNSAFSTQDDDNRSTQIVSTQAVQLVPTEQFSVNGVQITIPSDQITDLITVMKQSLDNTSITVQVNNQNQLIISNQTGGDIQLQNISGTPVQHLGFLPTTYPGGKLAWWRLLEQYGAIRDHLCAGGISKLLLLTNDDLDDRDSDASGTIQLHPTDQNLLIWQVDPATWPAASLAPIQAIINPQQTWPSNNLPPAQVGQRYLLIDDMAVTSAAWGNAQAMANDVIEFDGVMWQVVFDHLTSPQAFVKNQFSGKWYQFESGYWQTWPTQVTRGMWRLQL
jgi:ribosomal protein S4